MGNLNGKVAVVTGASKGIGASIAEHLAAEVVQYMQRLLAETKKAYGKLDILVTNAGVYEFAPLEAITSEHMHKLFNVDVFGLIHTTQEAVKLMEPSGGSIINIGSIVGAMPVPQASVYSGGTRLESRSKVSET
jgi:3-oxoacyl-[acyl-carrier protein] reductase